LRRKGRSAGGGEKRGGGGRDRFFFEKKSRVKGSHVCVGGGKEGGEGTEFVSRKRFSGITGGGKTSIKQMDIEKFADTEKNA